MSRVRRPLRSKRGRGTAPAVTDEPACRTSRACHMCSCSGERDADSECTGAAVSAWPGFSLGPKSGAARLSELSHAAGCGDAQDTPVMARGGPGVVKHVWHAGEDARLAELVCVCVYICASVPRCARTAKRATTSATAAAPPRVYPPPCEVRKRVLENLDVWPIAESMWRGYFRGGSVRLFVPVHVRARGVAVQVK